MRILLVSNEVKLNKMLVEELNEIGYTSDVVETLEDAKFYLNIRKYGIILIDSIFLDGSNIDIISDIKSKMPKSIIVLLCDNNNNRIKNEALKAGANDYIIKPFDFKILFDKLGFGESNIIEIGNFMINLDEERITYNKLKIRLEGKPLEVFTYLAKHHDQIVSKQQLLDALWEEPELVTPSIIDVAIMQIRENVDKQLNITTIKTIRRGFYRFVFIDIL